MSTGRFIIFLFFIAAFSLAGGALSGLVMGRAEAKPVPLVEASEFRLVDDYGRTRALMSLLRGRPRLMLLDEKGEFRIELGLDVDGGPSVWLRDEKGQSRLRLALTGEGRPQVELSDNHGRARAAFGLRTGWYPSLILSDAQGRDRLALWQETEEIGLALADESGRPRAGFSLSDKSGGRLAFYDSAGRTLWAAPSAR